MVATGRGSTLTAREQCFFPPYSFALFQTPDVPSLPPYLALLCPRGIIPQQRLRRRCLDSDGLLGSAAVFASWRFVPVATPFPKERKQES